MIKSAWRPIDEDTPKDRKILLRGGEFDSWYDDAGIDPTSPAGNPVVGWWDKDEYSSDWRFCSYGSGIYGSYEDPKEWTEVPE